MAGNDSATILQSWTDADLSLKDLGERERRIAVATAKAAEKIAAINERLEADIAGDAAMVARLKSDIEAYTRAHADEMDGRSKRLTYGIVRLRAVPKLSTLSKWTWEKVLARLHELKRLDLIRTKHEVNKDAIEAAGMSREQLATIGCRMVEKDSFSCETIDPKTASS